MNLIVPNINIGNSSDARNLQTLKENKITAILNVANDLRNHVSHKDGIEIAQCGLTDSEHNNLPAIFSAILQLENLILKKHNVLIHCHEGRSRSVFVTIYYLLAKDYFDIFEEAFQHVKSKRPEIYDPPKNIKIPFEKANVNLIWSLKTLLKAEKQ